ncbi:SAM-dependent methyltransferase [Bacteroidia bacterium]|nr:SAM-dependent methyltransferase [Bacteroidia bacterium]GHT52137.1 SAM-dependent methyltransferase [Bacteroidia bacterium]
METNMKKLYKKYVSERKRNEYRVLFNKITSIASRGNTFHCNCCGKSFRKFKSKGTDTIRANAECPYCGSLERTRVLLFYIENETKILTDPVRLLHFAPEFSLYAILKQAKNLNYLNVDINPNLADFQMDIMDIPCSDESFDYIICSHVLGHVPDEKKAIKELYRVLAAGGTALIMTLIDLDNPQTLETEAADTPEKRLHYYTEPDLLRLHGTDFNKRLEEGGFEVEVIDYASQLGEEKKKTCSLGNGKRELIFKCTKSHFNSVHL